MAFLVFARPSLPVLLLSLFLVALAAEGASGVTIDRILATIDNEAITLSDYRIYLKSIGRSGDPDEVDEAMLKGLVEERVVAHAAVKKGMDMSDAEVETMLEEFVRGNGMTREAFEKELAQESTDPAAYRLFLKSKMLSLKLIHDEVDSRIVVSEKEMEDFYVRNRRMFISAPERVKIKIIFLKLNDDATITEITDLKRKSLVIMARLKEGVPFELLIRRYSEDSPRLEDGSLGEFERGTLLPQLDEKAFAMKKGEVSDPIWVKEGVYILKLEDRVGEQYRPFSEVKDDIHKIVYAQKRAVAFNEWMRTVWEKASVSVRE